MRDKDELLNYIHSYKMEVDFEVNALTHQLDVAEGRLEHLEGDVKFYKRVLITLSSIALVFFFLRYLIDGLTSATGYIQINVLILQIFSAIVGMAIILLLIFIAVFGYKYLKAKVAFSFNSGNEKYGFVPPRQITNKLERATMKPEPEPSIQTEIAKVSWLLNEYYKQQNVLTDYLERIRDWDEKIDIEELEEKVKQLKLYEGVGIAEYGAIQKDAKTQTISLVFMIVCFGLAYYFLSSIIERLI